MDQDGDTLLPVVQVGEDVRGRAVLDDHRDAAAAAALSVALVRRAPLESEEFAQPVFWSWPEFGLAQKCDVVVLGGDPRVDVGLRTQQLGPQAVYIERRHG